MPDREPTDTAAWAKLLHRWTPRGVAGFLVCIAMAFGILYVWYLGLR